MVSKSLHRPGTTFSADSMYDDDWDDDWGDDGDFYCNDGTSIPMDFVNDGYEDCADGEDEMDMEDEFGVNHPDWVNDDRDDSGESTVCSEYDMDTTWFDGFIGCRGMAGVHGCSSTIPSSSR